MYSLTVENKKGQRLLLTQNESIYQIVNIDGLNPPQAEIYTNAVANMDGEKFKSSKLHMRNLVLTVKINGDAEQNRLSLYNYFGTGKWCRMYYRNGSRNVHIEGYCETIDASPFTNSEEMQVSIVCPNPYFKSLELIHADISKVLGRFIFPFSIDENGIAFSQLEANRTVTIFNEGELPTGLTITLSALRDGIVNPTIYNADTGEYMLIETSMNAGDVVTISTSKGDKSIVKESGGEHTNIINSLAGSSTWLQLETGETKFTYDADTGDIDLIVVLEYNHLYEGV